MEERPAGIKTFLIADVRGYTTFTQERGDEAAAELTSKFAELARSAITRGGGALIEVRGDEALAVFDSARQAIRVATDLQEQLVAETIADPTLPLAVGIGLDAGEAVRVGDGYRGGALNLAARLCSLAGPGEVLASREVSHLARKVEGVEYVERGSVRLKGLSDPIDVIRVRPEHEDLTENLAFRRALGPAALLVADGLETRNPYKGLRAFEEGDAADFFGRERLTEHLVERVAATRFLAVVGPSGSGKSSVVRAGLVPELRRGALPGSERWLVVDMFPGAYPLEELEAVLARLAPDARGLLELLEDGELGLLRALKRALPADDSEVVLVLDQLEEVFTLVEDDDRRKHFLAILERAVSDPHSRLRIVTTLRADFYDRPLLYSGFAELLRDYVEALVPLMPDEFERAISGPAERVGVTLEPGLLSEMVTDVANEPGALPLLQYALTELYERREGNVLSRDAYHAIGGVSGALAGRAEEIYSALTDSAQEAARQLFLRLVTLGEGAEDTRRRVERPELDSMEVDQTAMAEVADSFGRSRLLSFDRDPRSGTPTVEVAHEALLREWGRLRRWIDSAREHVRLHRRLSTTAREWHDADNDPSFLLRGGNLAQFELLADESDIAFTELEREFIDASRSANELELARRQRQNRRLKLSLAGVAVLLALAVVAGIIALLQRQSAQHQATVALARQLGSEAVVEPRIDRAMLLAHESVNLNGSPETEGTLLATLLRSPAAVATFTLPIDVRPCCGMSVSPDGGTLAISDNANNVRFIDTKTRRVRKVVPNFGYTQPVAYAADGSALLDFGGEDVPEIRVLDPGTLRLKRTLHLDRQFLSRPTESPPDPFVVAPNGSALFFVYHVLLPNGTRGEAFVDRWRLRTGELQATVPVGVKGTRGAALVAGGSRLLVAGDSQLTVLDAATLKRVRTVPLPPGLVVAIRSDGRVAAVGSEAGSISFVDLSTGRVTPGLGGHSGSVVRVEFSPDGRRLVTTAEDGSVIVWDARTAQPVEHLSGHGGRPLGIAFSTDGKTLYTSSLDGAVFEWDLGATRRFGVPFTTTREVPSFGFDVPPTPPLAVSPDGSEFAVRLGRSRVGFFSVVAPRRLRSFRAALKGVVKMPSGRVVQTARDVNAIAWSPSREIAVVGSSGQVQLWSLRGKPHFLRALTGLHSTNNLPETVMGVAFSPDGRLVAATDLNHTPGALPFVGRLAVWRSDSGKLLWQPLNLGNAGDSVVFSPDGKTIAAGLDDGRVLLVDAGTGHIERTLRVFGNQGAVHALSFARDGTLATGSDSGIVQLWNPATGAQIGHPTLVAAAPVASIAFDPSGESFATTGGSDGLAKLWTTKTQQQFGADFPADPGQVGNARYTPDGSKLIVVYGDGEGFVWPTSVSAWEDHACAVAGRNLTREEWARFVGARSYSTVCPDLPSD